ncbi:MAG TPA: hypothetical protein VMS37_13560 [Verrucomicrobiae bacterium]|nr:hypothetical protein [Verrucomicrobiae bacterium]
MIGIPPQLDGILDGARELSAAVKKTVVDFDSWISRSPLVFFPEYTDHGPAHITSVLNTAEQLMTAESLEILTAEDAGALVIAAVLHDCAMHLTNDGFRRLVSGATELAPVTALGDRPWSELWEAYIAEAVRFSPAHNNRLFGDPSPVKPPSLDDWNWDKKQDLLAGEFIRRHHARLAHQIGLHGFPGAGGEVIRLDSGLSRGTRDVIGLIARSHGMELRPCLEYLQSAHFNRIDPERIRALYLMVVLRIADYLQIEAGRAPATRIRMQAIRSTLSIHEWKKHHAVPQLTYDEQDPQARNAIVSPHEVDSIAVYVSLGNLTQDIQRELDKSWAILGEVYGRLTEPDRPLFRLGLRVRRLRTNLDDPGFLAQLQFHPEAVRFQSADARLFELLIEPLYGPNTDAGVRELVQNSVDAVRELNAYCRRHKLDPTAVRRTEIAADVAVDVAIAGEQRFCIVRDRGIGMTLEIVRDYFLKVGASYRTSAAWRQEFAGDDQQSTILRTGYFGVGALAAFLLGDEVRVVTRHVTAGEGLEFTASLKTDAIQVDRVPDCPVGTTITVPLRMELAGRLWVPNLRYFLAEPTVQVQGEAPKVTHPDIDSPGTAEWQRLKSSQHPVVFWRRGGPFVDRVIHNGFMVEHGDQPLRSLWADGWYGLRLLQPPLHVLDREGNQAKPYLNLARTEFRPERFPALAELGADVLRDFIAFHLATTPQKPDEIQDWKHHQYRYVECVLGGLDFERAPFRCLPVVYTRDGVVPLDAGILRDLGIHALFLTKTGPISELMEIDPAAGVLLFEGSGDYKRILYPREGIEGPPAQVNVTGSGLIEPGSEGDIESQRLRAPKEGPAGAPAPATVLATAGKPRKLNAEALRRLGAVLRRTPQKLKPGVAVHWTLGPPEEEPDLSPIDAVTRAIAGASRGKRGESLVLAMWRKFLGGAPLPFDPAAREAQCGEALKRLAPYVAAWQKLRQK